MANGSNVVVTVLVAHLLSTRGYGALVQLLAVFLVLSMPGSALGVAVVRRVAAWGAAGSHHELSGWISTVRHAGTGVVVAVGVPAWLARGWLAQQLSLPSPDGLVDVVVAGVLWAVLAVERGLLQSRHAYRALAVNMCLEAGVRAAATIGLVVAGLGVEGAALALTSAMVLSVIGARWSLASGDVGPGGPVSGDLGPSGPPSRAPVDMVVEQDSVPLSLQAAERRPRTGHLAADLVTALGALGLLAVLQNLDVLVLGREAPAVMGAYGAVSVTAKAVVFAALVLCGYLLPEAVARFYRGDHALRQLGAALVLVAAPTAALTTMATIFPKMLLGVVYGPDKTGGAAALAPLALAMGCLASTVLFTHYLLGIGRRRVVAVLAVGTAALASALISSHGRMVATARAEFLCQSGLAAVLGFLAVTAHRPPRGRAGPRDTPVAAAATPGPERLLRPTTGPERP